MTYEIKLQVGSPHTLRDHLRAATNWFPQGTDARHTLEDALAQVESQLKPAVEEPEAFGSIVRASCMTGLSGLIGVLWQKCPEKGKHYWESETGVVDVWSELTDVEVLRVGIGDATHADNVYAKAVERAKVVHTMRLRDLRSGAITAERQDAYDKAIRAIEKPLP